MFHFWLLEFYNWFLCLFDISYICHLWFFHAFLFLAPKYFLGSFNIQCLSIPQLALSPRSPSFFYWRMVLITKLWMVGVFIDIKCVIVVRNPQMREQRNTCGYIKPAIYICHIRCLYIQTWFHIDIFNSNLLPHTSSYPL